MAGNLEMFRNDFLGANTWAQVKDGAPLYLLDRLSADELVMAESELIKSLSKSDAWPILGLGHIRSKRALPALYNLLEKCSPGIKITIAHAIFQICQDKRMINIVLEEIKSLTDQYKLIDILYLLPGFGNESVNALLNEYCNHKEYLVAYNATRALGLPTENVVHKFRKNNSGA